MPAQDAPAPQQRPERSSGDDASSVTLKPISIPISHHSGRSGRPKIIVLHSTEGHNRPGTGDLNTLHDVLDQQGLSVHVGNDSDGNCARYVDDSQTAFHCAHYNGVALGIEQIGFAAQGSWPKKQTDNTAAWIAYWTKKYNIPIRHSIEHGICTHKDLGVSGGNHGDPGPAYPFNEVLQKAASINGVSVEEADGSVSDPNGTSSTDGGGGGEPALSENTAKATAFATFFELPGLMNSMESQALRGQRSLMNDQPLFPFVEQLCAASLRSFQSMPNGNFFAFYPDYFGSMNWRTPYWEIHDVEIINGQIELNDDSLATHVYAVGDTVSIGGFGIEIADKIASGGVVNIFNAFMTGFLNQNPTTKDKKDKRPILMNKAQALAFLEKYGARPYYEEAPMVRSPYYEAFLAYQRFLLLWSKQMITSFEFTFMPELFPGGIVAFPEHGIQCFIDEVVHECSYTDGFVTRANLSAPAALKDQWSDPVDPQRAYAHSGMIHVERAKHGS